MNCLMRRRCLRALRRIAGRVIAIADLVRRLTEEALRREGTSAEWDDEEPASGIFWGSM